jgi:hypothetical protein
MTTKSIPIPKPLWDALENVLMVKSKELIKDIAKTLNQSEKPLLEAFKAKKHSFHLLDLSDPTDEVFQCQAILCTSAVAHRCRKPVLYGQCLCPAHEFYKAPHLDSKPTLQRLQTETGDVYFINDEGCVYDKDYQRVGTYKDNTLFLFTLDDEEEYA